MQLRTTGPSARATPLSRSGATLAHGGWMQRRRAVMGTEVSVQLWAEDRARGAAAMAAVMAEMQRIERAFNPRRADSELARVNAAAGSGAVPLSDELYRLLVQAVRFSRLSGGAFDINHGSADNFSDDRVAGDDAALAAGQREVGWPHLRLDPPTRSLRFGRPGMRLDLGGFARGHAVDASCTILRRQGVQHAIVSAGGDSRVLGDRLGQPWTVAVRDPRDARQLVAVLPLVDIAVSTRGDDGGNPVRDGVRHPLPAPRGGRPPSPVRSVTVLADNGLTAAALGQAVWVLGIEAGFQLVRQLPGADAVVVDDRGALHCTDGLAKLLAATTRPTPA